MFITGFQCIACGSPQRSDFEAYTCHQCDGNLDVTYDYTAMSERLGGKIESEAKGVFRYEAFLPVKEPEAGFPLAVGNSPIYRTSRLGQSLGLERLFLKDDSRNPSASLKDRASAITLCAALQQKCQTVATASTGNAGSSMACLAAALGMDAVVFVPEKAPIAKLGQLLSYDATVLTVNGNYDDAYDLCLAACEYYGWFNRSTGHNPFTREGKKTISYEIWEDLGYRVPDRVVVPTGDGNIISAVWKGWTDLKKAGLTDCLPKIDCAQSSKSDAIARTVNRIRKHNASLDDWSMVTIDSVHSSTLADSISVDQPRDGLAAVRTVIESGGEAVTISDEDIMMAARETASLSGVFPEPAAAAPIAALKRMRASKQVDESETVVCIVTGSGLKDVAAMSRSKRIPKRVDPDLDAVRKLMEDETGT